MVLVTECFFNLFLEVSQNSKKQNNCNSNWKKLLGFRNIQEKLENLNFPPIIVNNLLFRGVIWQFWHLLSAIGPNVKYLQVPNWYIAFQIHTCKKYFRRFERCVSQKRCNFLIKCCFMPIQAVFPRSIHSISHQSPNEIQLSFIVATYFANH